MPTVTPFLWFNDNAEAAMQHYTSIFKNSKIVTVNRLPNGGIVMGTSVETQAEVDEYYSKLLVGGREDACGGLQDKFGLSWQIVPTVLGRLMGDKDPAKAGRVMQAMMQMKNIDIAALQHACHGA